MAVSRWTFPVGMLGCNCTILASDDTRAALIVDPGDDPDKILAIVERERLSVAAVVHTHAHFDHVMGTAAVARATGADVLLHKGDRWLYDNVRMQTELFGVPMSGEPPPPPTRELAGDDRVHFGAREAHALHTPGHTPGSLCFYLEPRADESAPLLLAGDTLFKGSIGRTDLWGGSAPAIAKSITERLLTLPDATIVVPGHGPETTVGAERDANPFIRAWTS